MSRSVRVAAGRICTLVAAVAAPSLAFAATLGAQGGGASAPATARAAAPKDFTGYWVSVVTEKWRYRMIVPDKGDYIYVPLNTEGRKAADAWDPAKDQATG